MKREPFQYAVIRVVPRIEREEFVNVGVILFCRTRGFLGALIEFDPRRVIALAPDAELDGVADHLEALARVAAGDADAGPVAQLDPSERFGWLTATSSTMVQTSSVHTGLTDEPAKELDHLLQELVLPTLS